MLAPVSNPPPFQAKEPVPQQTDHPASEYYLLDHEGHGLDEPGAAHRSPPGEKEWPKEQETCSVAALSIFPPKDGREVSWDQDRATQFRPLAARGEVMLPASSQATCAPRSWVPAKKLISERGKQHWIHSGSESAEFYQQGVRSWGPVGGQGKARASPKAQQGWAAASAGFCVPRAAGTPQRLSTAQGRGRKYKLFLF